MSRTCQCRPIGPSTTFDRRFSDTMTSEPWALDTSTYTHLFRAGHGYLLEQLAPSGLVLIPSDVNTEIEEGRARYSGIPAVSTLDWARQAVLTEEEDWTKLIVKAQMGGSKDEHIGECAVIACSHHRGLVAVLDERAAIAQAELLQVPTIDTMWIVIEAHMKLFDLDRVRTEQVVDDLLATGMWLPLESGAGIIAWAYRQGLLPDD